MRVSSFKNIWISTVLVVFAASQVQLYAQAPMASLSADTTTIVIGAQAVLTLKVENSTGLDFVWPMFSDTVSGKIEIVKQTTIDTLRNSASGNMTLVQRITITCFDSGYYAIPPITFPYRTSGDTAYQVIETNPLLFEVKGVDVDPDQPIRDIKELVKAPYTLKEIFYFSAILVLVAGVCFGVWYYLRRRKMDKPLVVLPKKPAVPPHRLALDELDHLRTKRLWQNGRVKEFHSELTDILRKYLHGRFGFDAPEMTTSEIMEVSPAYGITGQTGTLLNEVMQRADLVKFAKSLPLPDEHERSLTIAVDFVRVTIPQVTETENTDHSRIQISLNSEVDKQV